MDAEGKDAAVKYASKCIALGPAALCSKQGILDMHLPIALFVPWPCVKIQGGQRARMLLKLWP